MFEKLAGTAAALAACATLIGAHAATTRAAVPVVLGGGSGIVVNEQGICSLTTIGRDGAGRLVGFTAAHCGGEGSSVTAAADREAGPLGTVALTNVDLDYAVIVFEPDRVTPVSRVGNTTITQVGGPAKFPDIACKEGYSTGQTCGLTYGDVLEPGTWTWTQICVVPGDSGGPVVVGTTLVSMVNAYVTVPCLGPQLGTKMTTVIEDVDARGGPGAGFRPI